MKLCTINANSISPPRIDAPIIPIHRNSVKLDLIGTLCHDLGITETWLNSTVANNRISIPGFQDPLRCDRRDSYGGVAVYVANHLNVTRLNDIERGECVISKITSHQNSNAIYMMSIYRPPKCNNAEVESFIADFREMINNIQTIKNPTDIIVTLGDFNFHCSEWWTGSKNTTNGRLFHDELLNLKLEQIIGSPTFELNEYQALLDLVITSRPDLVRKWQILDPIASFCKHCPVYTELLWKTKVQKASPRKMYYYKCLDNLTITAMNNYLCEYIDWDDCLNNHSVDANVSLLTRAIQHVADIFITHRIVLSNNKDPDWLKARPDLRAKLKKRHKLFRKLRLAELNYNPNISHMRSYYSTFCKNLDKLVVEAKDFDVRTKSDKLKNSDMSSRCYYSTLKNLLGKKVSQTASLSTPL